MGVLHVGGHLVHPGGREQRQDAAPSGLGVFLHATIKHEEHDQQEKHQHNGVCVKAEEGVSFLLNIDVLIDVISVFAIHHLAVDTDVHWGEGRGWELPRVESFVQAKSHGSWGVARQLAVGGLTAAAETGLCAAPEPLAESTPVIFHQIHCLHTPNQCYPLSHLWKLFLV